MPGCARSEVVAPGTVGVYHCWGRCVRRAWLCGIDPATATDYEHRRNWIRQLQEQLAGLFAVEIVDAGTVSGAIGLDRSVTARG